MIVYFSGATGFTHKFVQKLGMEAIRIPLNTKEAKEFTVDVGEFVLIVPSYGSNLEGHLPHQVKHFLNKPENRSKMVGVIGAGNMNFGDEYSLAADIISKKTGVPVLYRFELAGTPTDIDKVREGLIQFWQIRALHRKAPQISTHV